LVNSFDSLLFLLALGIVGSDGDNIVKNISWVLFIFTIYYLLIPKKLGSTIVGKLFGLKLVNKDGQSSFKISFIFHGILILFPMLTLVIFSYIISNTESNGVYALINLILIILWFLLVILKSSIGKKEGLHNTLSGAIWVNSKNKK
jgi:hypothetical protein